MVIAGIAPRDHELAPIEAVEERQVLRIQGQFDTGQIAHRSLLAHDCLARMLVADMARAPSDHNRTAEYLK